jgi:hypothetical protein
MTGSTLRAGRSRFVVARVVAGLLGLTLAGIGLPALVSGPAVAAGVDDGSDWGSDGLLSSDSPVTVRWDNQGNPATSVVPRDGRQVIPHTGGQTYDDVAGSVVDQYAQYFGADNGLGGLTVQVSQTRRLVNQAVDITISGSAGGAPAGVAQSTAYFQVMQCWGGLTASGKPDPGAAQPDPATCQVGALGPDAAGGEKGEQRYLDTDPLALDGDWKQYYGGLAPDVPFTAIDGTKAGSLVAGQNAYFNQTTTNELSDVTIDSAGTANRTFEMQTSVESSGLGCGKRTDAPSTRSCWLVIVPRVFNLMRTSGAISPSLWAQRLQVRLDFRDISLGCPGGQARTLVGGSELLSEAAASWTPGVCNAKRIALGYTKLGDQVARNQFASGAQTGIATTEPMAGAVEVAAVPTALVAPVLAYNLAYQPNCLATDTSTEESAKSCGYDSLAALQKDSARAGTLVRDLNLDARLVAKLLTQSYVGPTYMVTPDHPASDWMIRAHRPGGLLLDPEFLRLNPDLVHEKTGAVNQIDHMVVEALRSDAAATVWQWVLGDSDAAAFLNGCPDEDGMTINPFYSTRTYVGCEDQRMQLRAQADTDLYQTEKPSTYADLPLSYPPNGTPYPVPTWQEYATQGRTPQTVIDRMPPVNDMALAGRDVAIGYVPANSVWCATDQDASCQPAPGKWKDPKTRQRSAALGVMAITDSATAARFQLPTANLCDSDGEHCVGAGSASLAKAAGRFVDTAVPGVVGPGLADYAAGAYPLTTPVYTTVSLNQEAADRNAYADALDFVTSSGQHPGFDAGELPPGYAPLTPALAAQARTALSALRAGDPVQTPSVTATPSGSPTVSGSPTATPGSGVLPGGGAGPGPTPGGATPGTGSPRPPSGSDVSSAPDLVPASSTERWPGWLVPFGLAIALAAGLCGPLLRLRGSYRIGRGTP